MFPTKVSHCFPSSGIFQLLSKLLQYHISFSYSFRFLLQFSIRKNTKPGKFQECFSIHINSNRLELVRSDEQFYITFELDILDIVWKRMGIATDFATESMMYPMFAVFTKLLERSLDLRKTSTSKNGLPGFFDPSLSTAISLDHFLKFAVKPALSSTFIKCGVAEGWKGLLKQIWVLQMNINMVKMAHLS